MLQQALNSAKIFLALFFAVLLSNVAFVATTFANGSDSATPYTVTAAGVTLPAGTTFPADGHVNYKARALNGTVEQSFNVHFDAKNNQPGGRFIGQSFFGFRNYEATPQGVTPKHGAITNSAQSAFPTGYCITWVQVSMYNQHFGEGGQAPVCTTPPATTPPADEGETKKVEFCHATGSVTNPYVEIETSVNAFYQAGHDGHADDIVPPFTYVKQGQTVNYPGKNWDAAHQAIYNNGCNLVVVPPINVTPAIPTQYDICGTTNDTYTIPETNNVTYFVNNQPTAKGTYAATGTVNIRAEAAAGYKVSGTAQWTFVFTNAACPVTIDVCPNLDGNQTQVPTGYVIDQDDGTCQLPGGRGGDEPVVTTPTPVKMASVVTSPTQLTTINTVTENAPELANTGDNTIIIMLIGIASIVFAISASFSVRQRT